MVVLSGIAYAQDCDFTPKCVPNFRTCGCGGNQTRYTLCDGGCSGWYPCSVPDSESACADSTDNDCDGSIDCADSDCSASAVCIDADADGHPLSSDCDDSAPSTYPGAPELCNLVDDDCDGTLDEGCSCTPSGSTKPCSTETGVCTAGTQTCLPDGTWGVCTGVLPVLEVCDLRDNDCDGQTDEGCECVDGESRQCGTDTGVCSFGSETCLDGRWAACAGGVMPSDELCGNGLDDDCNGAVDETCPPEPAGLEPGAPVETPEPAPEAPPEPAAVDRVPERECIDLDGDGYGLGCARAFDCDDTDASVNPGAREVCNSVDDDCNTMIDDQLTRECGVSAVGVCRMGAERCIDGQWLYCNAVLPYDEVCGNGLDDDCDGQTDEDCASPDRAEDELALRQFLDIRFGAGNYDAERYLDKFRDTQRFISLRKSTEIADGRTRVRLSIVPVRKMYNLTVFVYIPKSIASSAGLLSFSVQPVILQSDPLVMWHFAELSEPADLSYEVAGEFEGAADDTKTVAVAESTASVEREWYFDLIPLLIIPVVGFVFIFLVEIAHKRRK
ncbi:hypothetical protein KY359_04835 [Candidatus Woesearchaeota archaeon]|nr:hypothetical protein [Candidatus Woesearchaeota archaeon]